MTFFFRDIAPFLYRMFYGLANNLQVASLSLLCGLLLGLVTYNAKVSYFRPLRVLANCYIEIIRNTPLLVQIYLIFFGIAQLGINASPFQSTMIAMVSNSGGYCAEIMRAGFKAVSHGTVEAGYALGMSSWQVFFHVRLKPAFRSAFPALTNQYVLMFLGSSVASTIAYRELLHTTLHIESMTARTVEVFLIAGLMFYTTSFLLINVLRWLEKRIFRW